MIYSRIRGYLYTNARARLQTSPAAVGTLFSDSGEVRCGSKPHLPGLGELELPI